jgi:hypothetical protein
MTLGAEPGHQFVFDKTLSRPQPSKHEVQLKLLLHLILPDRRGGNPSLNGSFHQTSKSNAAIRSAICPDDSIRS